MFGEKQKRINDLQAALANTELCYNASKAARTQLSTELDQALESITGYEGKVEALETEAARAYEINQAMAEANRDLTYQNQLLVTVLKTLRIPVTLPARKR